MFHLCCSKYPNFIAVYCWIIFHCVAIWHVYPLSLDGHLDSFCFGVLKNNVEAWVIRRFSLRLKGLKYPHILIFATPQVCYSPTDILIMLFFLKTFNDWIKSLLLSLLHKTVYTVAQSIFNVISPHALLSLKSPDLPWATLFAHPYSHSFLFPKPLSHPYMLLMS